MATLRDKLEAAGGPTADAEAKDAGLKLRRLEAEVKALRGQVALARTLAVAALAASAGLVLRTFIQG